MDHLRKEGRMGKRQKRGSWGGCIREITLEGRNTSFLWGGAPAWGRKDLEKKKGEKRGEEGKRRAKDKNLGEVGSE